MVKPTVEDVSSRFGLSSSSVKKVLDGEVVTKELDASNDKDLSLLVVAVVDADLEKCWEFLQAEKVADIQVATVSFGLIDPSDPSLADMELDDDAMRKFEKDPEGTFFLSKQEAKVVKDGAKCGELMNAYRKVLEVRARAFWENGLAGIVPYDGKNRDPQIDLKHANDEALHFFTDPLIREEILAVPSKSNNKYVHSISWSIQKGRDLATATLNHHIRYKRGEEGFVSITRRFYSGYDYDSCQIVAGVLPTADGRCVIFYTNHTYSPAVSGFGGTAKRSIGRKMMVGKLVETMKRAQEVAKKEGGR